MKIAVRAGHNYQAPGASGILSETAETRKVVQPLISYLRAQGHDVLDVTPGNCDVNTDLAYGVNKANSWGANLFVSIHFNKAYSAYDGAIGSEVLVYSSHEIATRTMGKLAALGFGNRGVKVRPELYELRMTSMNSMIVETCFVEATKDVELYNSLGSDRVARAIAEGITGSGISGGGSSSGSSSGNSGSSGTSSGGGNTGTTNWVSRLQKELNVQFNTGLVVDGISGPKTLSACIVVRKGATGNITRLIQEKLISLGYNTNGLDGIFGQGTENAVKSYQGSKGLLVDGVVGRDTWSKMLAL